MTAPRRPQLCVGGVVVSDGDLLLIRRKTDPGAGLWSLPGGRVEFGETMAQAVERELYEETGLRVVCGDLVGWVERTDADYHFAIFDFAARLVSDRSELLAGTDASDAQWAPLAQVHHLQLVDGLAEFLSQHGVIAASG